ncbi:MAG: right-handed parallel beta-helix repeat-containing protein [Verrucomicrobiota bacterium]
MRASALVSLLSFGLLTLTSGQEPTIFSVTTLEGNAEDEGSLESALVKAGRVSGEEVRIDLTGLEGELLITGDLPGIMGNLTLTGPGEDKLTVTWDNENPLEQGRFFEIDGGARMAVSGIHFHGGNVFDNPQLTDGGAILIKAGGKLTVDGCRFTGCEAESGGAIYNGGGQLKVSGSTFARNTAFLEGGAIYTALGKTEITGCTFHHNYGETGGAIANAQTDLSIDHSTISTNEAEYEGGGLHHRSGQSRLEYVTITLNKAGRAGGGLAVEEGQAPSLRSSIIAANDSRIADQSISGPDIHNLVISKGHNLIGSLEGAGGLEDGVANDREIADPLLGELAANGGATLTHLPLEGSPAIDAGPTTTPDALVEDQRGFWRLIGSATDIGAVENGSEVPNTYAAWATRFFGPDPAGHASFLSDYDGDGILNLREHALGLDPTRAEPQAERGGLINRDDELHLTLFFEELAPPHFLTYTVEVSSDLTTWEEIYRSTTSGASGKALIAREEGTDGRSMVTVMDPESFGDGSRRFIRLCVRTTEP